MAETAHLLSRAKGATFPSRVVALEVDTTTDDTAGESRVRAYTMVSWRAVSIRGERGIYDAERWEGGRTADDFWHRLSRRLERGGQITLVSHGAIRTWGLLGLWGRLTDGRVVLCGQDARDRLAGKPASPWQGLLVVQGPPVCIECRIPKLPGKLLILDIANWLPEPVWSGYTAAGRCDRTIRFYLGMVRRLRDLNMGGLKWTAPSQAYHTWLHKGPDSLVMCHDNASAAALERAAYYGGRAEAFRIGSMGGPVFHIDVSAQYRSLYSAMALPGVLVGSACVDDAGGIADTLAEYGAIADVTLTTDQPDYPLRVMPPRRIGDDEHGPLRVLPWTGPPAPSLTVWPVGTFRTTLAGPELMDAYTRGRVQSWHAIAWYRLDPVLASYGALMRELLGTCAKETAWRVWAKLLANTLVGKLGQTDRRWLDAPYPHSHGPWGWWEHSDEHRQVTRWRCIGHRTQVEQAGGWAENAVPAMACWITAAARMQMLSAIRIAGRHHCYYGATDSLYLDELGYDELCGAGLIDPEAPGLWRLENVYRSMRILGVGHYVIDGREVCAGMPGSGGTDATPVRDVWVTPTVESAAKRGRPPVPIEASRVYGGSGLYRHGTVRRDGIVMPWIMEG